MAVSRDEVLRALGTIRIGSGPLPASGRLSEISVDPSGRVSFAISADPGEAAALEPVRAAAEAAVKALPGAGPVFVTLTADRPAGAGPGRAAAPPSAAQRAAAAPPRAQAVPGVKRIVAVASGKGGVGKSTLSCNLALALRLQGLAVGLLDADIYGPSAPKLFGLSGKPRLVGERMLEPLDGYGVKVMSIGFLVEESSAMIWRGPMVTSAIQQLLREVAWGELDVLIVDMPPGTGDAQLTMAQSTPLTGAVIVSTPQDLALIDARRGVAMFQKVEIPILGVVENMASFACPHCGTVSNIFGHGGARREAEKLGVPFLGEIPLQMEIRETSDAGRPVVVTDPGTAHARAFMDVAQKLWAGLQEGAGRRAAPRIVIE
ncbi:P-loop NTPase [Enterovirga aerilata]|uniref:Iron-sulfur cluster carrier protein n=1 Tax=Enterovirga aerilata TaxID=2730920 RepID=A0A849I0I6_9HYPH|nr:Mrp/NBP35 family ATP-binding protein [Enterovirga sp. DB1703]